MTTKGTRRVKPLLLSACAALAIVPAVASAQQTQAPAPTQATYDIPAQDLGTALTELARQSNREIYFSADLTRGKHAPRLRGQMPVERALKRLLDGSGLIYKLSASGAITIESAVGNGSAAAEAAASIGEDARSEDQQGISEILVVGSRSQNVDIRRTENDAQPYVVFGNEAIAQSGASNVETFLKQQLTMNTVSSTNSQASPTLNGGNTSSINLRGLGTNETLILINGRRSAGVFINGKLNQPDLNGIPTSAIERIEVLPTSASAIYGGAALGGVVNVILKKDYTGGDVYYHYEKPQDSGAWAQRLGGAYGFSANDGRTHIMVSGSLSRADPIMLGDRSVLAERGISRILANFPSLLYSAANPFRGATPNIASASGGALTLKAGDALNSTITFVPVGASTGDNLGAAFVSNAGAYNLKLADSTGGFGLKSRFGSVPKTSSVSGTLRQTITDNLEIFFDGSLYTNKSNAIGNPFDRSWTISSSAPTNPFEQNVRITFPVDLVLSSKNRSKTSQVSGGAILKVGGTWSAEVDYTWSQNRFKYHGPLADSVAFTNALNSGEIDPFVDTLAHPLNLMRYVGQLDFAGSSSLSDIGFHASGKVGKLPGGKPTLTVGIGRRIEGSGDSNYNVTYPFTSASNVFTKYFSQSQTVTSLYAEALIPLVSPDNHVPLVNSLDLQLAGRFEHFSVEAGTSYINLLPVGAENPQQGVSTTVRYSSTNPTVALKYRPVSGITLRASYARAFLPPTNLQLLPRSVPQCRGGAPCFPVVDPKNGQQYLVDYTAGGNPDLNPQRSKSVNIGVVIQPKGVLTGLRLNLEHYWITQPNYIVTPTVQQIVSDPRFADRVSRDANSGEITSIDISPVNATKYKTSGWDISAEYTKPTSLGVFGLRGAATLIESDRRQYGVGSPFLDYAGYPNDGGQDKFKGNGTFSWSYKGLDISWMTTFYGSYKQIGSIGSPSNLQYGIIFPTVTAQGSSKIPSQVYHDLTMRYILDESTVSTGKMPSILAGLEFTFGISNIFNTAPPFDAFSGPYYYSMYGDPRLRTFRFGIRKSL